MRTRRRLERILRLGAILGVAAVWGACGASRPSGRGRTNVSLPAGVDGVPPPRANRNAPPPAPELLEPLPAVVLWCSQPAGAACTAAQGELGLTPTPAEAVPFRMLSDARDLDDDCSEPELAELLQRVSGACGVQGGRTVDQTGRVPDASSVADVNAGSGCVNVTRPGDPTVKIHAADDPAGARYLVRVWEIGET